MNAARPNLTVSTETYELRTEEVPHIQTPESSRRYAKHSATVLTIRIAFPINDSRFTMIDVITLRRGYRRSGPCDSRPAPGAKHPPQKRLPSSAIPVRLMLYGGFPPGRASSFSVITHYKNVPLQNCSVLALRRIVRPSNYWVYEESGNKIPYKHSERETCKSGNSRAGETGAGSTSAGKTQSEIR